MEGGEIGSSPKAGDVEALRDAAEAVYDHWADYGVEGMGAKIADLGAALRSVSGKEGDPSAALREAAPLGDGRICTGCGWDSRKPLGGEYLGCCPDSRYRTPAEVLREALAENPESMRTMVEWVANALEAQSAPKPKLGAKITRLEAEVQSLRESLEATRASLAGAYGCRTYEQTQAYLGEAIARHFGAGAGDNG